MKVYGFAVWSSRICAPDQALTTPLSDYQPQPWRGAQGGWAGEVVAAQQPQSHLQAFSVSSPHPAHLGIAALGSQLKPHPGSACPTHREPGGTRARGGGGSWEEGRVLTGD